MRAFGDAETFFSCIDKLGSAFAVALGGAGNFRDAFANEGLGNDDLGFAVVGGFCRFDRGLDGVEIMTVDGHCIPADGGVEGLGVLALRHFGHRIERDVVGVENEDQVVELIVRSEGDGLTRDAFLKAPITREGDHMIVDDLVLGSVVFRRSHLAAERITDGIADALPERPSGGLDAWGFMELGMAGRDGMQDAEFRDIIDADCITAEVQPGVDEHGAMACGEDKTIAVQPFWIGGVALEGFAEKDGTDFCGAERESEVAGVALVDGIHGETTGFIGGLGEEGFVHEIKAIERMHRRRPGARPAIMGCGALLARYNSSRKSCAACGQRFVLSRNITPGKTVSSTFQIMNTLSLSRRTFVSTLIASAASSLAARDWSGQTPERYPDPDLIALEPEFEKLIQGNAPIRRLHTGMLWAEGPAWNGSGNYLVWSDIPNNAQMRYLPEDGHVSVMRNNANNSNGNTFDMQGRQISFKHATRRVVRYELDGRITVLADQFEGKPLNAPNDGAVHPDGGIWFTDPGYGSMMDYEGNKGELLLKEAVYRIDPSGKIEKITDDLEKPNGLCFSPDYKKLYVVDTGAPKNIRVYDVDGAKVKNGKVLTEMNVDVRKAMPDVQKRLDEIRAEFATERMTRIAPGRRVITQGPETPESRKAAAKALEDSQKDLAFRQQLNDEQGKLISKVASFERRNANFLSSRTEGKGGSDGVRCDIEGNVWASAGWIGDGYDGVHVFSPEGKRIGQIKLPETTSNLCFGGPKRNRLFITASQSLYSVYVNTRGAHWC